MTEEHGGMQEPQVPQTPSGDEDASPAQSAANAMENMFSTGEGMVAVSGVALLLIWLIFEVITDDYGLPTLAIVLAAVVAIAPRLGDQSVSWFAPLSTVMKASGYILALVGVTEIIGDIETGIFDAGAATVIAALLSYAAYAVAFLGARQIEA